MDELYATADAKAEELESLIKDEHGNTRDVLTAHQEARGNQLVRELDALDKRIAEVKAQGARESRIYEARSTSGIASVTEALDARVTSEPQVYGYGSQNSYYADLVTVSRRPSIDPRHLAAAQRFAEWSNQVEHEVAEGSNLGKRAERQLREQFREGGDYKKVLAEVRERGRLSPDLKQGAGLGGAESRAISTGGGATASAGGGGAAAFVTLRKQPPPPERTQPS